MNDEALRILLVEDHPRYREALADALVSVGFAVTAVASAEEARGTLDDAFALAVVDLHLESEVAGTELIAEVVQRGGRALALTAATDERSVLEALDRGASGYVSKADPLSRVLGAIEDALAGHSPLSSDVTRHVIRRAALPEVRLSPREQDLLVVLARGLTYAEAADALGIRMGTVQTYVRTLYRKLGVSNKAELCAFAYEHQLVR
ncbi:MAG: response regulator transcription factor [Sandaracinaceae bacterium]|nr:response regulator transcription factor [Myxococcales bacterium]MCB9658395.1 response regulator transcription factor [Sandaracinaceae bacterium]